MDFRLPELGEGVYEAEFIRWLVKPGDTVKRGQVLMEMMTDKATMEVPAPFSGTIQELRLQEGQQVKIGEVVLAYDDARQREPTEVAAEPEIATREPEDRPPASRTNGTPATATAHLVKAAPSVRFMARKLGIDLASVHGSGPGGRVLIDDVAADVKRKPAEPRRSPAEERPDYGTPGTRIKLQGLRRKIAEHMSLSKRTIPHYSYVDECNVTDLVRLRDMLREPYAEAGVRLTYLAFFVKAAVAALREVPIVNSSLDESAGEIVLHDRYHIGVAVATPAGLIVPVIHDADRKDLVQIAREIDRMSAEARAGRAKREDVRGGTFTISSIGNVGGLISTPVINHPEVAILGLGKIVKRPVYDPDGNIKPAELLYLSYSFDHRVLDGAVGAVFGNALMHAFRSRRLCCCPRNQVRSRSETRGLSLSRGSESCSLTQSGEPAQAP